jgi:hypothetical protein
MSNRENKYKRSNGQNSVNRQTNRTDTRMNSNRNNRNNYTNDNRQVMSTMDETSTTESFPKLTNGNWFTWQKNIKNAMEYKGLWQHIKYEDFEEFILVEHGNYIKEEVLEIRNHERILKKESKAKEEKQEDDETKTSSSIIQDIPQ